MHSFICKCGKLHFLSHQEVQNFQCSCGQYYEMYSRTISKEYDSFSAALAYAYKSGTTYHDTFIRPLSAEEAMLEIKRGVHFVIKNGCSIPLKNGGFASSFATHKDRCEHSIRWSQEGYFDGEVDVQKFITQLNNDELRALNPKPYEEFYDDGNPPTFDWDSVKTELIQRKINPLCWK